MQTCSSGDPKAKHSIRRGITPAWRAALKGGNSDLDNNHLSSRSVSSFVSAAPFPLKFQLKVKTHRPVWKG